MHAKTHRPVAGTQLGICAYTKHAVCDFLYNLVQVFSTVDPCLSVQWTGKDGDHVTSGTKFGIVKGNARSILVAERVALNFVQRMSGIATATAAMTDRMQASFLPFNSPARSLQSMNDLVITCSACVQHPVAKLH